MTIKDLKEEWNRTHIPITISDDEDKDKDGDINGFECKWCNRIIYGKFTDDSIWCNSCNSETLLKDIKPIKKPLKAEVIDNTETLIASPTSVSYTEYYKDKVSIYHKVEPKGTFAEMQKRGIKI